MRDMVGPLHLTAHSAVADFESGRRLPAPDILAAYERHFRLASGSLLALRHKALAERAAADARHASLVLGAGSGLTGQAGRGVPVPAPAQLPHDASAFAGRISQLQRLHALAAEARGKGATSAIVICSIDGMAGVGKSALAVHFAHQVADRFPDGQLHVDLRGHDSHLAPLTPTQALGRLLRSLGADPARLPTDPAELAAYYRSLLSGRRVLIMLDNAADTVQVRPLLPGRGSCLVLVTSRRHLPGLIARDGAQRLVLGPLGPAEAMDLFTALLGPSRVGQELEAASKIAELCGYLPLALRITAERAIARTDAPLAKLAAQLTDERTVLASLVAEDDEATGVRAAFSLSYRDLPADQARLFRLLSLHPGSSFTASAGAALAALSPAETESLLAALTGAHLVERIDDSRYRIHDLLRVYGLERLAAENPPADEDAAIERVASWYLHSADAAAKKIRPARRHPALPPEPAGVVPLTFAGYEDALGWLDAEHANCAAAADVAHLRGLHSLARAFPGVTFDIFELRGMFEDWTHVISTALASARALGDQQTQATLLSHMAIACARTARYDQALGLLQESLELRRSAGDRRGEAATLGNIGNILNELGRPDEALPVIFESAALHRSAGDKLGEAMSLGNLGLIYERQGRYSDMIEVSERALPLFQNLKDRPGEARVLSNLAAAYSHLRRTELAIAYGQRALAAGQACGARDIEALALRDLGQAYLDQGRSDRARSCWRESVTILEELGDPASTHVRELLDTVDSGGGRRL